MAFSRKRSGSEKRKRAPIIGFRATDEERARIEAAADRAGLTVGSYVRSRALSNPTTRAMRRPPVRTAQLAQLLGLLGATGGVLQRIEQSRSKGDRPTDEALIAALAEFRQAAAAILQTLGKRPHDH
jgi:hypothetical protein